MNYLIEMCKNIIVRETKENQEFGDCLMEDIVVSLPIGMLILLYKAVRFFTL